MEFIKLESAETIGEAIKEFLPCFPHLLNKIDNIYNYSVKLNTYAEVYVLVEHEIYKGISVFYANDKDTFTGYISLIGIKEEFQKMKLGGMIIRNTHEVMEKLGMKYSKLEVDNDNINAMGFYLHEGYSYIRRASEASSYLVKNL